MVQFAGAVSGVQLTLMTAELAVVARTPLGADGTAPQFPPPPVLAAALTENPDTPSPSPPVQISNPYSTSISHHDGCRLPRDTASEKNGSRFRFVTDVTGEVATYDTIFHELWFPVQTSYCAPLIVAIAARLPNGCTDPPWFNQIMTSVPFGCPDVVEVWLNQISYAASLL